MSLTLLVIVGCAADRPIHLRIGDEIRRPERAVVIFFIDGFGRKQFDEALAAGRIPNIEQHLLRRGVHVETAVTCIPSITYANSVTFITGRFPGHHGIVSNKWFEPGTGKYQNYSFIKTYQLVDGDYSPSPTIYDILYDRVSVSIQTAIRRGATHTIDNWAISGINWFFDNPMGVDAIIAQQFELIARRTSWWGRWPDLIFAYFPGADNIGHRFGPDSSKYHRAIANIDRQIGRICEGLRAIGMYDRTYLCLVSDHGMTPVEAGKVFDITEHLKAAGQRVWHDQPTQPGEQRVRQEYDYAVAVTASRWAAIYPLPRTLLDGSAMAGCSADLELRETEALADKKAIDARKALPVWLAQAISNPAVELAAVSFRRGRVHLFSRERHALIVRADGPPQRHRVFQDSLEPALDLTSAGVTPEDPTSPDSRAWLEATARSRYPDLVPQVVAMFDSERAGNIVLFAAAGWDFCTDDPCGGHGSILADEMLVPMVFAGPGLKAGGSIRFARNTDVAPTVLQFLGVLPRLPDGTLVDMDGISLLPSLATNGGG